VWSHSGGHPEDFAIGPQVGSFRQVPPGGHSKVGLPRLILPCGFSNVDCPRWFPSGFIRGGRTWVCPTGEAPLLRSTRSFPRGGTPVVVHLLGSPRWVFREVSPRASHKWYPARFVRPWGSPRWVPQVRSPRWVLPGGSPSWGHLGLFQKGIYIGFSLTWGPPVCPLVRSPKGVCHLMLPHGFPPAESPRAAPESSASGGPPEFFPEGVPRGGHPGEIPEWCPHGGSI
jgi:hypothetical protein